MAKVRGRLKSIWPDRTQYKPYAYNLELDNVFVEIDVPDESVRIETVGKEDDKHSEITLDLNGFTCLLGTVADALQEMDSVAMTAKRQRLKEENAKLFN